jgi:hypothetical protein
MVGGLLHFAILLASAAVPRVLDWHHALAKLDPLSRQLIWTHGAFIVLVIIGFGTVSVAQASELAGGTPLARTVCGFIALFWAARLALQYTVLQVRPYLHSAVWRLCYHSLSAVFGYHVAVYGLAAIG